MSDRLVSKSEKRSPGFTLIELLIAIAILGMTVAVAMPALLTIERHAAARAAAGEIRGIFSACRSRAIARGTHSGVKFIHAADGWSYALYDDGNGNGIRNQDIADGIDRMIARPRRVLSHAKTATIALLPFKVLDPDGDPLLPNKPAVQFGNSTIASFSPLGAATPGTIYLSDTVGELYAVRLYGASAKVRLLRYDLAAKKWDAR